MSAIPNNNQKYAVFEFEDEKVFVDVQSDFEKGEKVMMFTRPALLKLYGNRPKNKINVLRATVEKKSYLGAHNEYWLRIGENEIRVQSQKDFRSKSVYVYFPPQHCNIMHDK